MSTKTNLEKVIDKLAEKYCPEDFDLENPKKEDDEMSCEECWTKALAKQ